MVNEMDEFNELFSEIEAIHGETDKCIKKLEAENKRKDDYIKQLENRILLLEEWWKNQIPGPPAIQQTITRSGPIRISPEVKKKIMDEHYFKKLPYEQLREYGLIKSKSIEENPLRKAGII